MLRTRWPGEGIGAILFVVVFGLVVWGYIANILKIAEADEFTALVIARIVGLVVAPLGIILGWIG